jgi:DNA-binding MarR family transcriptional regulator
MSAATSPPSSGSRAVGSPFATPSDPVRLGVGTSGDDVDRLVAAWQRERPDLDVEPLHVLSRVARVAKQHARIRAAAFAEHGLDDWEFDVLAALRRAGDPYELSPGQLVAETLVTSGTMTTRVDRLIERGLVERRPDPRDRRGVLVRLTEPGRGVVDGAMSTLLDHEHTLVAALQPKDRAALPGVLRRLLLAATEHPSR